MARFVVDSVDLTTAAPLVVFVALAVVVVAALIVLSVVMTHRYNRPR